MSARLQTQFDCLYQEELARWDAQIKALQVHINPHFLNNTLESINWQARMSGDVKASGMIEARSTVLDAAPDRKVMPQDQGWLIGTYMYDETFNRGNVDYGSAIAMLIVVLGVWSLTTLYPFVWVILNSFREKGLIRKDSFSIHLPGGGFTMDNYSKAMDRFDFANAYFNSLIVSVSATVVVILAGLAAYGLVRCRFACGACATGSSWRG